MMTMENNVLGEYRRYADEDDQRKLIMKYVLVKCVAVCCSVLQCVAVCCSVLQGVACCEICEICVYTHMYMSVW